MYCHTQRRLYAARLNACHTCSMIRQAVYMFPFTHSPTPLPVWFRLRRSSIWAQSVIVDEILTSCCMLLYSCMQYPPGTLYSMHSLHTANYCLRSYSRTVLLHLPCTQQGCCTDPRCTQQGCCTDPRCTQQGCCTDPRCTQQGCCTPSSMHPAGLLY